MKKVPKIASSFPIAIGFLILILDSKTAIKGAKIGLELCFNGVIPSLFPFIFLSSLLTASLLSSGRKGCSVLCKLYGIPYGSEGILLTGLLGGYPVGAKCIGDALFEGRLKSEEAERMIIFCNAVGPAFIFGIISNLFAAPWVPWCLWGLHVLSGLCMARILPHTPLHYISPISITSPKLPQRLRQSLRTMAEICGWIILMRTVITFAEKWILWRLPAPLSIFITGLLELTNGCIELNKIDHIGLRFMLCSTLISFGGICIALQTRSVAPNINQKRYIYRKTIQAMISFTLAYIIQFLLFTNKQTTGMTSIFLVLFILLIFTLIYSITNQKKVVEI